MNIVLLGAPGSGKGTLSQVLIDKYNFYQISTGDLIREIIKTDSPLGNELKKITSEGKLVSDEFVKQLVLNKIEELKISNKSIIFDGFPRNIDQAKWLASVINIDYVINLNVPFDLVLERLSGRRVCPACNYSTNISTSVNAYNGICDRCGTHLITRTDDQPETIKKRYDLFTEFSQPLLNYYNDLVFTVDGSLNKDIVTDEVIEHLGL